jgi:hypothetical protein
MSRVTVLSMLGQNTSICYSPVVSHVTSKHSEAAIWGPYPNYDDVARFEYGRRMWRLPDMRSRLLRHWTDPRHPYNERFSRQRVLIEDVLVSVDSPEDLDNRLRVQGTSLRCVAREIPPVFGSFF